ncbi:hypothetical protein [Microbulbifer sp. HZ11]|uniref:hypothetical protein n=1 Tax=Microbulbifer sp. HZ11 TaxID=1453501 RepID=UPI0005B83135|nr:hypothetical protein [Microbulbifer sp. HZ11]
MSLNWNLTTENSLPGASSQSDREYTIYQTKAEGSDGQDIRHVIEASIDKACEHLEDNLQDDSRYLLFGWNVDTSTLTIVVTDDEKVRDAREVVRCKFVAIDVQLDVEDIQYWIKDYLTTCVPFLQYSLIAAFHLESRENCTLL